MSDLKTTIAVLKNQALSDDWRVFEPAYKKLCEMYSQSVSDKAEYKAVIIEITLNEIHAAWFPVKS